MCKKCLLRKYFKVSLLSNLIATAALQATQPSAQPSDYGRAVQHHGGPIHRAELRLARFVPQPLLGKPCARPAACQAQQVQMALFGASLAALRGAFVHGVDQKGQKVDAYGGAQHPPGQPACPEAPGQQSHPAQHQQVYQR